MYYSSVDVEGCSDVDCMGWGTLLHSLAIFSVTVVRSELQSHTGCCHRRRLW